MAAGEVCDDGLNNGNYGTCNPGCFTFAPNCGDGVVQMANGEQCDDGNRINNDACSNSCVTALCGDGVVNGMEECDDANMINTDACTNACVRAICGDGIVGPGEICDDGTNNGLYGTCNPGCASRPAFCGDGPPNGPEQGDDGVNNGSYGTCNVNCTLASFCPSPIQISEPPRPN